MEKLEEYLAGVLRELPPAPSPAPAPATPAAAAAASVSASLAAMAAATGAAVPAAPTAGPSPMKYNLGGMTRHCSTQSYGLCCTAYTLWTRWGSLGLTLTPCFSITGPCEYTKCAQSDYQGSVHKHLPMCAPRGAGGLCLLLPSGR